MSVDVGSNPVINDSSSLINVTGGYGQYDNFQPKPEEITGIMDFEKPCMYHNMTQDRTFTPANLATGKCALFLLDTSSDTHTPNFPNVVTFTGGTPSWGDYRHWQITMQAVNNSEVRASALGYTSTYVAPTEVVSLAGTASVPQDTNSLWPMPQWGGDAWYCTHRLRFTPQGKIQRIYFIGPPTGSSPEPFAEWCNITPSQTYYIRATQHTTGNQYEVNVNYGTVNTGGGPALGSWWPLTTNRDFGRYERYVGPSGGQGAPAYGFRNMKMKFDIATDANGTNIIETGYYVISWEGWT
jgi:hypothetical protein